MAVFSADLRKSFNHTPLIDDPLLWSITRHHQLITLVDG